VKQALHKPQQLSLFSQMVISANIPSSWFLIPPDSFMDDMPPEREETEEQENLEEKEAETCFG
jgi:hypothetical protein